jgi:hypothetical protein
MLKGVSVSKEYDFKIFQNPPLKYLPFPFFLLNDEMDEKHLDFTLSEYFKNQKF